MLRRTLSYVVGAAIVPVLLAGCSPPPPAPEAVRSVRTLTVSAVSSNGSHDYAAEIRARTEVRLAFRVGGKLQSRHAEVGQHVQSGEVLARLDPLDLQLSQQAAAAAVRAAKVSHELTLADYRRFKDLRDQGFISSAELDRRQAALAAAAAQLEQARAQASVQGNQAAYTTLVAPGAGIVLAVDAEPGTVLAAGTPVLRLALDGPRDVVFAVPEDALPALRRRIGQPAGVSVRLWGSGHRLTARVRELAAAADPVTRTFQVKADLQAPPVPLLPLGLTATASIDAPSLHGVTLLPLTAVREHQGGSAVWVFDPVRQVVHSRAVRIGGAQGNDLVVLAGVRPGEQVVTAGVHVLTEGQAVQAGTAPAAAASAAAASAASTSAVR